MRRFLAFSIVVLTCGEAWAQAAPPATGTVAPMDWKFILGVILGLCSALAVFEFTEWRRRAIARKSLKQAVVAELELLEATLATVPQKYAQFADDKSTPEIAKWIRWQTTVGRKRVVGMGLLDDLPSPSEKGFEGLSDAQLVRLFAGINETTGIKVITPIIDRALATGAGFTARQIQMLGLVRFQAYLLEVESEFTREFFRMSYTVTGDNHANVIANHDRKRKQYCDRALTLLRVISAALKELRGPEKA